MGLQDCMEFSVLWASCYQANTLTLGKRDLACT